MKELSDSYGLTRNTQRTKMESNAKLIEWTDGTYHLVIGDQYFNVELSQTNHSYVYAKFEDMLVSKFQNQQSASLRPSLGSARAQQTILKRMAEQSHKQQSVKLTHSSG